MQGASAQSGNDNGAYNYGTNNGNQNGNTNTNGLANGNGNGNFNGSKSPAVSRAWTKRVHIIKSPSSALICLLARIYASNTEHAVLGGEHS